MRSSKLPYWLQSFVFAMAIWALVGTTAQAGDLGSFSYPAPTESWTGFSFGVGGGIKSLNANVNAKASRTDGVGCAPNIVGCPPETVSREIDQAYSSSFDDLGGTGGFATVQGAYDYQFAPRWVAGAFVDADWSDIAADANQTNNSSVSFFCNDPGNCRDEPDGQFSTSNSTISTKVRTEWNVSVGGRLGWLANQGTLLYVLAAYTHADLKDSEVRASIPDPNDLIGVLLGGAPGTSPFPNSPANLLVKLPDSVDGWKSGRRRRGEDRRALVGEVGVSMDTPRRRRLACREQHVTMLLR